MEHQELLNQTQAMLADPGIPDWAKFFGALVSIIVIIGSAYLGRRKAAEPPVVTDGRSVMLEGALVDSSSIKMLSSSVEALGVTIKTAEVSLQKNMELMTHSIEALRAKVDTDKKLIEAMDELAEHLDKQRQGRDDLTHEMRELRMAINMSVMWARNGGSTR